MTLKENTGKVIQKGSEGDTNIKGGSQQSRRMLWVEGIIIIETKKIRGAFSSRVEASGGRHHKQNRGNKQKDTKEGNTNRPT